MQLVSKLPDVGTTIFTTMSQMAIDHQAINLGQGFPDFSPDPALVQAVNQAMIEGHNQYAPMAGIPKLRRVIADKIQKLHNHQYDEDTDITITAGASQALMASILALVHPGDEVLIIEPAYDLYRPAIALAGGTSVSVPMTAPRSTTDRYSVDWQRVRDSLTAKTRLMILNFPHNPTGINLLESDLDALEAIVQETGVYILSDEVYEHIVFDGDSHRSMCQRPVLADRSVVVSSFGKTLHITGWKIGYCCAPKKIMNEIRKVHQFDVFVISHPMQVGIANFLSQKQAYMELSEFYQAKHDKLYQALENTKLIPLRSEGTFFLLANYAQISDQSEQAFAEWLTVERGVTAIPVSAFYADPNAKASNHQLVRLCFAKDDQTLNEAINRLANL